MRNVLKFASKLENVSEMVTIACLWKYMKVRNIYLNHSKRKVIMNFKYFLFVPIGLSKTPESYDSSESDESHDMRLVGASPCSFGPSYWCSSEETINECKVRISFELISRHIETDN